MKNDREICKNFTNDYLIHVLSQMPQMQLRKDSRHRKTLSGSLQLLRAVISPSGEDMPQSTSPRHETVHADVK